MDDVQEWGPGRIEDLHRLVAVGLPDEQVSADELLACCWEDPGVVLASAGAEGAVAAVTRTFAGTTLGWIRLLVVHPGARRQGLGRSLVAAAEAWCAEQGAVQVRFGGSAPFYLWPGIDVQWTAGLCLAESVGYRVEGAELDLSCPTTFRAPTPPGVVMRRVVEDADAQATRAWCDRHYPHWVAELARGIEQGGTFAAFATPGARPEGEVVGFACHSVNRAGWVGPMATRPTAGDGRHVAGTGAALLSELCRDLMVAGYPDAEIAWVGPVSFYARTAGARVSRVFRTVVRDLSAPVAR